MLDRLRNIAKLHIPLTVSKRDNVLGQAHDERSGFGTLWLPAARKVRGEAVDRDALCGGIEDRFDQYRPSYRPRLLRSHPRVSRFF